MPAKKRSSTKSAAKKSTARKSTAKRATSRKATSKKSTAKRTAAKRATKRSTAKRSTAKRSTAKRAASKKSAAKRTATKRSTAKRTAAKRSTAKRSTAKRSTAKRASARKSSSSRASSNSSSRQDVVSVIKADHKTVDDLFKKYEGLGDNAVAAKGRTVERLVKELSVHSVVEEQVVYPRIRQVVGRGDSMVSHALDEHQEAKELLAKLERTSPESDEFDGLVTQLRKAIKEHVREEERDVLPALQKEVDRDELVALAKAVKSAKKGAPTRPHPWAPNTPPGNIVAGAVAGAMDRARDAGRKAVRGT